MHTLPRIFVFASDFHDTKRYLSHVLNGILTPLQHCAFAFYKIHTFLHRRDKNTSQTYFFAFQANYQINKYESCKTKSIFNFQLSINTLRFIHTCAKHIHFFTFTNIGQTLRTFSCVFGTVFSQNTSSKIAHGLL